MATAQHEAGMAEGPATFEKVWEMFQEIGRKQAETARGLEETARGLEDMKEKEARTERLIEENWRYIEETGRQMRETDKRVGALTNRYGEIAEHMIVPNLVSSFNALGYTFDKTNHGTKVEDFEHGIFTEADAFLENGDCVMVVEIKTYLRIDHIDDHVKRMEKFRARADLHNDKRKYYGAIAGLLMSDSEKTYALKKGFYVLEPVGETFTITTPQSPGAPKAW
ncbi:hypothetical protein AGMMS49587_12500 [Spirochaetia bacterium]|nr:hypothetical protein AGMMS49587_12500 [Spirochaetia bacterium]